METFGILHNYDTGEEIRPATEKEMDASIEAAWDDGGCGVIIVDGVRCFTRE